MGRGGNMDANKMKTMVDVSSCGRWSTVCLCLCAASLYAQPPKHFEWTQRGAPGRWKLCDVYRPKMTGHLTFIYSCIWHQPRASSHTATVRLRVSYIGIWPHSRLSSIQLYPQSRNCIVRIQATRATVDPIQPGHSQNSKFHSIMEQFDMSL